MPAHRAPSVVGAILVTSLLATRPYLPFVGPHAQPLAAVLILLFLFCLAYPLFALFGRATALPIRWSAIPRWGSVLLAGLVLALILRFYQFVPAFLVLAWCRAGLVCGEVGNRTFNSLLSAGDGELILVLLPFLTVSVLFVSHWLYSRQSRVATLSAA